ncbi:MAG: N-acetylmuramoyl-L-alanine amidase family protein [Candidatus Oleimicrobiaceae bacterium]
MQEGPGRVRRTASAGRQSSSAGSSSLGLWLALLVSGVAGCAVVVPPPPRRAVVKDIDYRAGAVTVEFAARGRISVRQHYWGTRLVVDLFPCAVQRAGRVAVGDELLVEYHWGQHDPSTVRVVVTAQAGKRLKLRHFPERVVIIAQGQSRVRPRERPMERPLMVLIDPGHGGYDAGTAGRLGTLEKEVTLDIALRLAARLMADRRFDVRMTRIDDSGLSLAARRDMARNLQPDLFMSLHLNASQDRDKSKTEIYYFADRNRQLARHVGLALMNGLGTDELIYGPRSFYVLRSNGAVHSILVEPLYLSNQESERLLSRSAGRERIARILYEAIASYFWQTQRGG